MRIPADRLGLPVLRPSGQFTAPREYTTPNGVVLPAEVVGLMFQRFNNPVVAPSELIPPSVLEGAMHGRVLHLPSPRMPVSQNPGDGQACEDCAHFRYEAGQEYLRRHGDPLRDAPGWLGPRSPRSEDMGLCASENVGDAECLTSRFWGEGCPEYIEAEKRITSIDARRGRRFDPLGG